MRDPEAAIVALALLDGPLVAGVTGRLYGGAAPPANYNPADGGAVCMASRGGNPRNDSLSELSIQVKCYGPSAPAAWAVYALAYTALHEKSSADISLCQSETIGQIVEEPETWRTFVLAYFRIHLRP